MTVGVINHTGPGASLFNSARAFIASWMPSGARRARDGHRPPRGMDLVAAVADELARDPYVQSVQCRHVHGEGGPCMEFVVVPARADFASHVSRSCAQMAALVTPVTQQESLAVRFHVRPSN